MNKLSGIELIEQERLEQVTKHKRTVRQDVNLNPNGELRRAAIALMGNEGKSDFLAMPHKWNEVVVVKMCNKPYKERLIIAGALIAAEIDRIQHLE